jgi:hypothetical protein
MIMTNKITEYNKVNSKPSNEPSDSDRITLAKEAIELLEEIQKMQDEDFAKLKGSANG